MTIRILIVDDSPYFRAAVKKTFQSHSSFTVAGEAEDGHKALDMVKKLQPDVILIDYALPIMNGIETAKKISGLYPNTKTGLISMFSDDVKQETARNGLCLCFAP